MLEKLLGSFPSNCNCQQQWFPWQGTGKLQQHPLLHLQELIKWLHLRITSSSIKENLQQWPLLRLQFVWQQQRRDKTKECFGWGNRCLIVISLLQLQNLSKVDFEASSKPVQPKSHKLRYSSMPIIWISVLFLLSLSNKISIGWTE